MSKQRFKLRRYPSGIVWYVRNKDCCLKNNEVTSGYIKYQGNQSFKHDVIEVEDPVVVPAELNWIFRDYREVEEELRNPVSIANVLVHLEGFFITNKYWIEFINTQYNHGVSSEVFYALSYLKSYDRLRYNTRNKDKKESALNTFIQHSRYINDRYVPVSRKEMDKLGLNDRSDNQLSVIHKPTTINDVKALVYLLVLLYTPRNSR